MKLKSLKIRNFRCYRDETVVDFENLSVFIGKNDAGKSSILEALEIFFNNSVVKIDNEDLNVCAAAVSDNKIEITCFFACFLPNW
ncbi:MAG: AAA family ATPase [Saprospirales bacterium]|nr:AAA family ATPase [Saprospirales bacterium]